MKKFNLTSVSVAALLLLSAACTKDKNDMGFVPTNPDGNAQQFVASNAPKTQKVQIDASALPKSVTLKGGTKITFPAGSLNIAGVAATGLVTVEAVEVLKRSDVLFYGSNTNHSSGAPLASDGFIYVDVKVNGTSIDANLAVPMEISIPAKRSGITQLWEGVDQGGNPLVAGAAAQMAWAAPRKGPNGQGGGKEVVAVDNNFTFNFGNTGWINTDVFYSYSNPKTTVNVDLVGNPGTLSSFHSYSGETYVYFCAKGSNVAAQLYTTTGPNSVKSYDDVMPVGVEGKFLTFSIKDGKYYYGELESTIVASQHVTLTLTETTEAAVQTAINSLDGY
ncbi:hypothetical protein EWM62_08720 [Mucilaginibacter terrigena]|uniref:Uncharacterized protein n=1 Tax=Mucilaginibacter terrigena TaxID=2492395 RepID=A0A4Q5LNK6_9SPHI|nr:hypothetical protein [Mucilaginibacter terrigena]RYU90719.1 hypothetical protein EWM62_08720 [Mucilaginibacter terrigena]